MKTGWHKASELTMDCFNKWGTYPYHAILEREERCTDGVLYQATILKSYTWGYIPCTGGVRLEPTKTMKEAKNILNQWLKDKTGK
jgi:hypothetical protein